MIEILLEIVQMNSSHQAWHVNHMLTQCLYDVADGSMYIMYLVSFLVSELSALFEPKITMQFPVLNRREILWNLHCIQNISIDE